MQFRIVLCTLVAVFVAFTLPAAADPPPLKVIKLQPTHKVVKTTGLDSEVKRLLVRIADDRTDTLTDRQDFDSLLGLGTGAVPALGATVRDGKRGFDERWVAARALGKIGGADALAHLRDTLEQDRFSMARLAAISALRDIGDRSVLPAFVKALDDDAMVVRSAAADGIGHLGDLSHAPALLKALERDDNYYKGRSLWVRRHIVAALGDLESKGAVPKLVELLDDDDDRVVLEGIRSLEKVTRLSFQVPSASEQGYAETVVPKWKAWWEENKKDYL